MSLIYSHRGFPVEVPRSQGVNAVYESPEMGEIYLTRRQAEAAGFETELRHIAALSKIWVTTGGLFRNALDENVRLSPAARSFILETAKALNGQSRRRVGFSDWELMLERGDGKGIPPAWNNEELVYLKSCVTSSHDRLIQKWIVELGLDDLIQTMFLYVGPLDLTQ